VRTRACFARIFYEPTREVPSAGATVLPLLSSNGRAMDMMKRWNS
jgi:hypothetical protein